MLPTAQPSPVVVSVIRGILRAVPASTAALDELLRPLRDDPEHSAVLLDVDGVLAPIVQHPDDDRAARVYTRLGFVEVPGFDVYVDL